MLKKLIEVQSTLYNEEILENLSEDLFIAYKNFNESEDIYELESIETSTASIIEQVGSFFKKLFEVIYNVLKPIIVVLKELYNSFKEILPFVFDKFIEYILIYSKKTKKDLHISFELFFKIFRFFGLEDIYPSTFDKIYAALQWKICSIKWINTKFLGSYKNSLLSNIPSENIDSIKDLYELLEMLEKEAENNRIFEEDVSEILEP